MSERAENDYPTADDEQAAHAATHAMQAHAVLFKLFGQMTDLADAGDDWADKVSDVLADAMNELETLAREEVAYRPGMPEAGRAWAAEFDAKHAAWAAFVEPTPSTGDRG